MKLNKTDDTIALSMSKKTRALKQLGGKCFICECNDFVVLDFHHINNDKEKRLTN